MSSVAVAPAPAPTSEKEYEKKPLRYRFRKAWRAILFVALVPFFEPSLITTLLPFGIPMEAVRFFAGMLVLIPLSTFIEVVTEDLIERLGQLVGGLLHAFFGNVAYFVLTATALFTAAHSPDKAHILTIVQSSISGTIVIDILFILGVSIFIGGMKNGRMQFSAEYSNQYAEMITIAVIALALPTLAQEFGVGLGDKFIGGVTGTGISSSDVTILSNITAIVLIVAYAGYLGWTIFKFRDIPAKVENPETVKEELRGDQLGPAAPLAAADEASRQAEQYAAQQAAATLKRNDLAATSAPALAGVADASTIAGIVNARLEREQREQRQGKPAETRAQQEAKDRNRGIALWEFAILILGTAGVVFISENMAKVFENETLTKGLGLNAFFVGFILLPVASNLVELSAAVSAAFHNRMETCLAVTAGSAIQVALLIAPLLVLVSHIAGVTEFKLTFGLLVLAIFALIAYLFQIVTVDGETTWLEGLQFTSFFAVIFAVALLGG